MMRIRFAALRFFALIMATQIYMYFAIMFLTLGNILTAEIYAVVGLSFLTMVFLDLF